MDQRKATSANRPGVRRWTGAGGSACRPALKPKRACALDQRTVHFSGEFSKRPHFTYGLYIYANLILGQKQEFLFMLHT